MKKILIAIMALTINFSNAAGIPTFDAGTIAQLFQNALEAAKQAKEHLDKLQEQIDYYKSIYEGNWNVDDILNADIDMIEGLPKEWEDIYKNTEGNIDTLRRKYNLIVDGNEDVQRKVDNTLYKLDFYEKNYTRNLQRAENFKKLGDLLARTDNPMQREDLANKIAYEQLQLQADRNALENMNALMEQQEKIREQQADIRNMQFFFGESRQQ